MYVLVTSIINLQKAKGGSRQVFKFLTWCDRQLLYALIEFKYSDENPGEFLIV